MRTNSIICVTKVNERSLCIAIVGGKSCKTRAHGFVEMNDKLFEKKIKRPHVEVPIVQVDQNALFRDGIKLYPTEFYCPTFSSTVRALCSQFIPFYQSRVCGRPSLHSPFRCVIRLQSRLHNSFTPQFGRAVSSVRSPNHAMSTRIPSHACINFLRCVASRHFVCMWCVHTFRFLASESEYTHTHTIHALLLTCVSAYTARRIYK